MKTKKQNLNALIEKSCNEVFNKIERMQKVKKILDEAKKKDDALYKILFSVVICYTDFHKDCTEEDVVAKLRVVLEVIVK